MSKKVPGLATAYAQYRINAEKRGIEFAITREEFASLVFLNCYLCGSPPSNERKIYGGTLRYGGIDRVSNQLGYVAGNVAPCCWKCNVVKGESSLEELRTHLEKMMRRLP